jgi:hypothetical protein
LLAGQDIHVPPFPVESFLLEGEAHLGGAGGGTVVVQNQHFNESPEYKASN